VKKLIPLWASLLFLLAAAGAFAQSSPVLTPGPNPAGAGQPEATTGGSSGPGSGPGAASSGQQGAGPMAGASQLVAQQGVSLAQAIVAAEQQGGGRAIEAEFQAKDRGRWAMLVLDRNGSTVRRIELDALTGQVTAFDSGDILAERVQPILPTAGLQPPTIPLGRIVVALEQQTGGRGIGAKLERAGERILYAVRIAASGGERLVKVDAASGQAAPGG